MNDHYQIKQLPPLNRKRWNENVLFDWHLGDLAMAISARTSVSDYLFIFTSIESEENEFPQLPYAAAAWDSGYYIY